MDKLKYIKLENEDGSYSNSIPLAVDGQYVDINGETLTNILENKANVSTVKDLESQVSSLASGSPAGVYDTITALTNADPDHTKIYIVSENGHWYYYNEGWQDGGVYQGTSVNPSDQLILEMNSGIKNLGYVKKDFEYTEGYYVNNGGKITEQNHWAYSEPIAVKMNETIHFFGIGYQTSVAMISILESNNSYRPVVISSSSDMKEYVYTPDHDCNIVVSFRIYETDPHNLYIDSNSVISKDFGSFMEFNKDTFKEVSLNWTNGYYASGGQYLAHANYRYSSTFNVSAYSTVYIKAWGESTSVVNILSKMSADGMSFTSFLGSDSASEKWYSIDVVEDSVLFACTRMKTDCHIFIVPSTSVQNLQSSVGKINSDIDILLDEVQIEEKSLTNIHEYYIASDGNVIYHRLFDYSEPIKISKNQTVRFEARGYKTNVAMISTCNEDGSNIVPVVVCIDSESHVYSYTAESDGYVCFCWDNRFPYSVKLNGEQSNSILNERLTKLEGEDQDTPFSYLTYGGGYCSCFHKIGVIGDSLASGNTNHSSGEMSDASYSWIQCIARICGTQGFNFSRGGMTTRSWLSTYVNNSSFTENLCTAYIIGLGVNDRYYHSIGSGAGVELGTPEDINFEDRTQCADTFYGNYANIIMYIKEVQPKAKIFVITNPRTVGETSDYNDAIRYMVEHFDNVYLIDLYEYANKDYESKYARLPYWNQAHGTALGYRVFANQILSYINYIIEKNINDFADIQFIGTDYHF